MLLGEEGTKKDRSTQLSLSMYGATDAAAHCAAIIHSLGSIFEFHFTVT